MRLLLFLVIFITIPVTFAGIPSSIIKPSLIDDEFYSETFTLFADMDNGQYLYAQIGVSNIGPGDQNGLCRIMIFRPGENSINKSVLFKRSQWHFKDKPLATLTVGLCSLTLDESNQLSFHGHIENTSVHIKLDGSVQNNITPLSAIKKDNGQYFSEILIPWSSATASSNIDDDKEHILNGFGYADHSVSTLLPADLASQWIRFRGINDVDSHLLLIQYPNETSDPVGWVWKQNESPQTILKMKKNKAKMPFINIAMSNNKLDKYAINAQQLIYRQAPLEEKGLLGKVLSKFIGNPVTYTYRASMTTQSGKAIKGILEVAIADE